MSYQTFGYGPVILKARIKGKIMVIDLASQKRDSYSTFIRKIKYLGKGTYYSYGDNLATDKKEYHFWKYVD